VEKQVAQLHQTSKSVPDAQITVRKTWEPLLVELIASSPTTIVLVLDALDECRSLDHCTMLLEFLTKFSRKPNGPYLLVSSHPHVSVGRYFDGSVQTFDVIQPETMNEMETFIEHQITSKRKEIRWEKSIFCEWGSNRSMKFMPLKFK